MRILNLQNVVVVSLLATGIVASACSSSDTNRPSATAGAAGTSSAGSGAGGDGSAGTPAGTAGTPAGTAGSGTAGSPGTAGMTGTAGSGTGGAPTTGVCAGLGTKTLDVDSGFVDNFECDASATFCNTDKVAFGWSTFNDLGTPGADAADNTVKMKQILPGYMSPSAGQYVGTGANTTKTAQGFGVGAVFNVAIDPTAGIYCADISAFDGISFWAKTGIAAGSTVSVNFVLPNTNAEGKDAMTGKENGGDCLTGCYNHPKKNVTLTGTWAQYTVTFAEATGGSAKVKDLIQELGFLSPDAAWDFSLDEIAFYKGTAPAAPLKSPGAM